MWVQTDGCYASIPGLPSALAAWKLCASDSLQAGIADAVRNWSSNRPCVYICQYACGILPRTHITAVDTCLHCDEQ